MKAPGFITAASLALLSALLAAKTDAASGCVQVCQATNRRDVQTCNYPKKEVEETKRCLATARSNFDGCMQACGK